MAMHVLLVQATMLLGVILSYTHGATAAITTAAATLSPRQYNILQEMVNCDGGHGVCKSSTSFQSVAEMICDLTIRYSHVCPPRRMPLRQERSVRLLYATDARVQEAHDLYNWVGRTNYDHSSDPCPPTTKCVNYADRDTQGPSCKLDKGCQLWYVQL